MGQAWVVEVVWPCCGICFLVYNIVQSIVWDGGREGSIRAIKGLSESLLEKKNSLYRHNKLLYQKGDAVDCSIVI